MFFTLHVAELLLPGQGLCQLAAMGCALAIQKRVHALTSGLMYVLSIEVIQPPCSTPQALQQHFQNPDFKVFADKVCILPANPVHGQF